MNRVPLRRRFLRAGLTGVAATVASATAAAGARAAGMQPAGGHRSATSAAADDIARLALLNSHTGESLDLVYREGGLYLTDAMAEIERVLRDHRSGDVHPIDRSLLDQLDRLAGLLGSRRRPFHVISGYRSPATNARLAARSGGVARHSLHMSGRAIDIRLPGSPLAAVHRAALGMQAGGVGYYARSNFVHLDVGRVRSWRG